MSSSLVTTSGRQAAPYQPTPASGTQAQQAEVAAIVAPQLLSDKVSKIYTDGNGFLKNSAQQNTPAYIEHFRRNHNNILKHAKDLTGSALILGSGNGHDVPLAKLAEQFDKVTLMDIDIEGMQKSIQKLPDGLRSKFHLVKVDLTGVLPFISKNIESLDASMSEDECIIATVNIVKESITQGEKLNFPEKHNFVVSSMLTGQLFSLISHYIDNVLPEKFPNIKNNPQYSKIGEAVIGISEHICGAHFDYLAAWTVPQGKVYYADTAFSTNTKLVSIPVI